MYTKPDAFQQQYIDPAKVQCYRCGAYTPKHNFRYLNPQTWEQINDYVVVSAIGISISVFFVIWIGVNYLLSLIGFYNGPPSSAEGACGFIPIAFLCAVAAGMIFSVWRRKRLSRKYHIERHFVCWNCKNEWTVIQDTTAKKSS